MPVETFGFPTDLNDAYPAATDGLVNGDEHLRGIKATIKGAMPGVNSAMTAQVSTSWQHIAPAGNSINPAYAFSAEPGLGFYRASAGVIAFTKRLLGNGAVPVGSLHKFLYEPAGLGKGGTGTGHEYLELDGSTWNSADFPKLAEHMGVVGSTFTLPNVKDTGRFLRSRTASVSERTTQANQNKQHNHTGSSISINSGGAHTHTGTTDNGGVDHDHAAPTATNLYASAGGTTTGGFWNTGPQFIGFRTGGASAYLHTHAFTTNSGGGHTHTGDVTVANDGGAEARPEALVVIMVIKT